MESRRGFLGLIGKSAAAVAAVPLAPILISGTTVSAITDPAELQALEGKLEEARAAGARGATHALLCPQCQRTPVSTIHDVDNKDRPIYRNTCDEGHRWVVR